MNLYHLKKLEKYSLREKGPYSELFWSAFFYIQTEYGEIRSTSRYLVPMRVNMDQKKFRIWALFTQWFTFLYFYKNGFSQPITKCLKNIEKKDYLNLIFIVTWKLIIIQKISPIIQNLEQALFHYLLPSFP